MYCPAVFIDAYVNFDFALVYFSQALCATPETVILVFFGVFFFSVEKGLDLQMLNDPFEEYFYLTTATKQFCYGRASSDKLFVGNTISLHVVASSYFIEHSCRGYFWVV